MNRYFFRRFIGLAATASLIGGGCLAPSAPTEPETPAAAREPMPSDGTYRTVRGNDDRLRNLVMLNAEGGRISSPLILAGEARLWYFEGSFPVRIENASGEIIVQTYASADGEWMTEDWVPFTAEIPFPPQPTGSSGLLILEKDNPSGLPEHDDRVEIPVRF